jgi:hypothetical protein
MSEYDVQLDLPDGLSADRQRLLAELAHRNDAAHGDGLLGLVFSGSVGRGIATERSDLDVYVVLDEGAARGRSTTRSAQVDEIPVSLASLETVPGFGTDGWWFRWSFAWAPVLLDRTQARIESALHRQATLTDAEAKQILVEHDRLDGWINYAYRALKNDRDGRDVERRLDAAESMPWLLDVVFTLAGRVRPYHKYLPWELREHPISNWPADVLLPILQRTLDGDPRAIQEAFARVEACCVAYDEAHSGEWLTGVIGAWGDELQLFRA